MRVQNRYTDHFAVKKLSSYLRQHQMRCIWSIALIWLTENSSKIRMTSQKQTFFSSAFIHQHFILAILVRSCIFCALLFSSALLYHMQKMIPNTLCLQSTQILYTVIFVSHLNKFKSVHIYERQIFFRISFKRFNAMVWVGSIIG